MPVYIPSLDDWTFDALVREGLSLLPAYAPDWTNHNPSDPGIMLMELLAYFTEMLVYRLGRVTPESKLQFLRLLKGTEWQGWESIDKTRADELKRAIEDAARELAHMDCAVTAQDFEQLAVEFSTEHSGAERTVRARCVSGIDLTDGGDLCRDRYSPGHVSLVVVPGTEPGDEQASRLLDDIREFLLPRSLLGTRLHVVGPVYLHIAVGFRLALKPGNATEAQTSKIVDDELRRWFGPDVGQGPQGEGWPFGRPLHISELIEVIDRIPGVDYVEDVTVLQVASQEGALASRQNSLGIQIGARSTIGVDTRLGGPSHIGTDRLLRDHAGRLVTIVLRPWELLSVSAATDGMVIVPPGSKQAGYFASGSQND